MIKNPYFWVGVSVLAALIIIFSVVYGGGKSATGCPPGQKYDSRCSICHTPCPSDRHYFDCKLKACTCIPPEIDCNGICCPAEYCKNGSCCSDLQRCGEICCGGGTVCKDGKCVAICGHDVNGKPVTCEEGQKCFEIENAPKDMIERLVKQGYRQNGNNLYTCYNDEGCKYGNESAAPAASNGYYGCYDFLKTDEDTGLGYCSSKSGVSWRKQRCYENCVSKDKCGKTGCESDTENDCEWHDVLEEGENTADLIANYTAANANLPEHGYWCGNTDTTNYSRVVNFLDEGSGLCSPQDCVNKMTMPGVTNVFYDAGSKNKACVAIQKCNDKSNIFQNNILTVGKDGKVQKTPYKPSLDTSLFLNFGQSLKSGENTDQMLSSPCDGDNIDKKCPSLVKNSGSFHCSGQKESGQILAGKPGWIIQGDSQQEYVCKYVEDTGHSSSWDTYDQCVANIKDTMKPCANGYTLAKYDTDDAGNGVYGCFKDPPTCETQWHIKGGLYPHCGDETSYGYGGIGQGYETHNWAHSQSACAGPKCTNVDPGEISSGHPAKQSDAVPKNTAGFDHFVCATFNKKFPNKPWFRWKNVNTKSCGENSDYCASPSSDGITKDWGNICGSLKDITKDKINL